MQRASTRRQLVKTVLFLISQVKNDKNTKRQAIKDGLILNLLFQLYNSRHINKWLGLQTYIFCLHMPGFVARNMSVKGSEVYLFKRPGLPYHQIS